MSIIEVRLIERERWHGLKGKDTITRPTTVEALLSNATGKLATGLSPEDRERLEKTTGLDLSDDYVPGRPHPFYSSKAGEVKLEPGTNIFDTDKPFEEIKVKLLKASDFVANSQKEYDEGKFPLAQFVIYDEREELEVKASKSAIRRQVILETDKLTPERKAEIIQITLGLNVRNQSDNFLNLRLVEAVEKKGADTVLTLIKRDKARTSVHAMALEAIHKNILRKEGSSYYYMDDQLGFDLESTLDYLQDKKNQALKAQIIEKLN